MAIYPNYDIVNSNINKYQNIQLNANAKKKSPRPFWSLNTDHDHVIRHVIKMTGELVILKNVSDVRQ